MGWNPFDISINGSRGYKRDQKLASKQQRSIANKQMAQYDQTMPYYNQALQYFAQRANPGSMGPGTSQQPFAPGPNGGTGQLMQGMQMQAQQPQPNRNGGYFSRHAQQTADPHMPNPYGQGPGGVSNQQMGIWNNPEDAWRMAQAQDQIGQFQQGQQRFLQHNLADRGMLDSGAYGSGLTRLADNANQQFADFRRNQAIGAGAEQDRRYQQLMGSLGPGMNMGQQAQQGYQQVGQNAMQGYQQAMQPVQDLFNIGGQLLPYFLPQPGQAKKKAGV